MTIAIPWYWVLAGMVAAIAWGMLIGWVAHEEHTRRRH